MRTVIGLLLVSQALIGASRLAFPLRAAAEQEVTIPLTADEKDWLASHPVIRLAPDPSFAPIEWFNKDGSYSGVSSDYVALLESRLGVHFEVVRCDDWKDALARVKAREVDALTAIVRTAEREAYLEFTEPYFSTPRAIFANRRLPIVHGLADLGGYKIAVVEGSRMDERLSAQPSMSINRFQDLATALIATSRGVTDVACSAHDTMAFARRQEGLTNLRLIATLPDEIHLSFGVRSDWATLVSILDKAFPSVGEAEAAAIATKWIDRDEPRFWEKPVYRYTALALIALVLVVMTTVISWNRTLNAQVRKRGEQLRAANLQLMQAEKLKSIGRLSAGIAHEVKNPLAIIQMGVDYLTASGSSDETTDTVIADMDDAVRRADGVVRGLLDFSHGESLELEAAALNDVVEGSLRLVGHELRQRRIEVELELPPVSPVVDMDANKLQQVLINLFMNSAHAIGRDGRIEVSCFTMNVEDATQEGVPSDVFRSGEDLLALRILDSGPGISEEDLARLFDPFFTTKPVGEGTGLGLSVSRKIIELHGGTLDLRNGPEGGAMATIYLKPKVDE